MDEKKYSKGTCGWQIQDTTVIGKTNSILYIQTELGDWERPDREVYREDQPQNCECGELSFEMM